MIIFLMLALSIITAKDGYKVKTWQDYASFDFEQEVTTDEEGNEVVTNLISTPEQLAGFFEMQSNENVYADNHLTYFTSSNSYKLKNNIDLSDKPWSPTTNNYKTLDGCFHIISNLTVTKDSQYIGFVTYNYGTIKNIYFENVYIENQKTDGKYSGTGTVCGYNSKTIDSVTVLSGTLKGNIYNNSNEDRRVGGICGYNTGTITHCMNHANISRGKFVGGIAGVSNGTISNCYNYGKVSTPEENSWPRLGGIVAENTSNASLSLCLNFGEVSSYFTTSNSSQPSFGDLRIGGVVGHSSVAVSKCGNYGNVTGGRIRVGSNDIDLGTSYVGGIVGYCDNSISDCFNKGNVFSSAPIRETLVYEGKQKTAPYDGGRKNNMYASNLTNRVRKYDYYAYAGGICARCVNNISNCYNTGEITGGFTYYEHYEYAYLYQYGYRNGWDEFWNHARDYIINTAVLSASTAYCTDSYGDGICPNKDCTISTCYYSQKTKIFTNSKKVDDIKILQYRYVCAGVTKEGTIALNTLLYTSGPGGGSYGYSSGNCYIAGFDYYFWCPWGRFNFTLLCSEQNADDNIVDRHFLIGYCWYDYIICSVCDVVFNVMSCNGIESSYINSTSISNSLGSNWSISSNINNGYPYILGMYW